MESAAAAATTTTTDESMDWTLLVGALVGVGAVVGLWLAFGRSSGSVPTSRISKVSLSKTNESAATAAGAAAAATASGPLVPLRIYFGSETGMAEKFSKVLAREAGRHGFHATVVDLNEFKPEMLTGTDPAEPAFAEAATGSPTGQPLALFLMATYGEGEPTLNATAFHKWLTSGTTEAPADLLNKLSFSVFGLGNRQYQHYNAMGKLVNRRLEELGAKRAYRLGEGDDDGSLEDDFEGWKADLWRGLRVALRMEAGDGSAGGSSSSSASSSSSSLLAPREDLQFECVTVPAPAAVREQEERGLVGPEYEPWPADILPARTLEVLTRRADMVSRPYFQSHPAKVMRNVELRQKSGPGNSTVHVELELKDTPLTYRTADNLSVLPENETALVEQVALWLGYDLDQWIDLRPRAGPYPELAASSSADATTTSSSSSSSSSSHDELPSPLFPTPCTVRRALTSFCDLSGMPSRAMAAQLAHYATKDSERDRLAHLTAPANRDEWHTWCKNAQRSVAELFEAFPSVRPPLGAFLELCPRLKHREYTIASSAVVHPTRVHLCVSVLEDAKPRDPDAPEGAPPRVCKGVCSNYIARTAAPEAVDGRRVTRAAAAVSSSSSSSTATSGGASASGSRTRAPWPTMRVAVRTSTFDLPTDPLRPIILVGPGTGIAPMRAFLQERAHQRAEGVRVGPTVLFFGCRKRDEDFVYEDELTRYARDGTITALHLAFSREQAHKIYVQDRIREQGETLWTYLHAEHGHIYVCGATRMGHDVRAAFADVAQRVGGLSAVEAETFLDELERNGRYVQELWA